MQIDMSFKHMDSTEAIKSHATEKSEKLTKYFDGKMHATWNFSVEKLEHIAHLHLVGNHIDQFCEVRTDNLYASIDEAVHKMEKQLRKLKEIVTDKHAAESRAFVLNAATTASASTTNE